MPNLRVSKDSIKAPEPLPEGIITVRFEGFQFNFGGKGGVDHNVIWFKPQLRIVEGPEAGKQYYGASFNNKASWIQADFLHAFGLHFEDIGNGELQIPGNFNGPEDDCTKWTYTGPLLGKVGKLYHQMEGNYQAVKYYICAVSECNKKHPEIKHSQNLLRKSA